MNADRKPRPAIHQLVPRLSAGDAVSNHVRWVQAALRAHGYRSEIYVDSAVPALLGQVKLLADGPIPAGDGVIYHHCSGTWLTDLVARHPGPKTMIYHNITPPEFFARYNPALAEELRLGRQGLAALAADYEVAYGVSHYNVNELRQAGFRQCHVLPIAVSADHWQEAPDPELMADLDDGLTNILFVGRVVPNKAHHDLIEAFYHYLCMDTKARLLISGVADPSDLYVREIQKRIDQLGLRPRILMFGHVSEARLHALYRSADLLWSMSEHEGFCVPLLEAMWFDIPVLAYKSSAIAETLGEAGLIFDDKADLRSVAAIAKRLVHDRPLRETVLAAQRRRRQVFLPAAITPLVPQLAERLVGPVP